MRAILVDWLVQVNDKFRLLQETLFLTVSLLDRYLAVSVNVVNIGSESQRIVPIPPFYTLLSKISKDLYTVK